MTMNSTGAMNDDELIQALLDNAAAVDSSQLDIMERMQDLTFQARYTGAKVNRLRQCAQDVNAQMADTMAAVAELIKDPTVPAETRLRAAKLLVEMAGLCDDKLERAEDEAQRIYSRVADPLQMDWLGR